MMTSTVLILGLCRTPTVTNELSEMTLPPISSCRSMDRVTT